jgi:hypothetical protein
MNDLLHDLPPAVVIHGLAQARVALRPGRPLTLLSAPGAAQYAGCLWWRELLRLAEFNGAAFLDCGNAPGRALEALKLGLTGLILTCPAPAFAVVAEIAAAQAATLLATAPPALDLGKSGAERHLAAWLGR